MVSENETLPTHGDREPTPPEKKEPDTSKMPEKDPPSKRRGPIEEPESNEGPANAPTDPEIERQGEIRLD